MTAGHQHRVVRVKSRGIVERILRVGLYATYDSEKVDRSRWVYRIEPHPYFPDLNWYVLSPLGILHGWFGLTLDDGLADDEGVDALS